MQCSNCFKGSGYCLLRWFAHSYLEGKLFLLSHCFLAYVIIALMHLFEIYIFHTTEAPEFLLTTTALAGIAGNIFISTLVP